MGKNKISGTVKFGTSPTPGGHPLEREDMIDVYVGSFEVALEARLTVEETPVLECAVDRRAGLVNGTLSRR